MSLAIVPGSYDPMTLGHLDVVRRALTDYDEVVVAVMVNASKVTRFDMETRVAIARATVGELENVRVISDTGLLVDLFDRLGADAVCKGYRNETDLAYERKMDEWNRAHHPRFKTVLYPASEGHETLSSTVVRAALEANELPEGWVHPRAEALIREKGKRDESL